MVVERVTSIRDSSSASSTCSSNRLRASVIFRVSSAAISPCSPDTAAAVSYVSRLVTRIGSDAACVIPAAKRMTVGSGSSPPVRITPDTAGIASDCREE